MDEQVPSPCFFCFVCAARAIGSEHLLLPLTDTDFLFLPSISLLQEKGLIATSSQMEQSGLPHSDAPLDLESSVTAPPKKNISIFFSF